MQVDFIRVPAEAPGRCYGCAHYTPNKITSDNCNKVNGNKVADADGCHAGGAAFIWKRVVPIVPAPVPQARTLDPATSKSKRKASRYAEAVVFLLGMNPNGLTGKQMAELSGFPLNCITPRFAPLRRKGLIKDSGNRRDKQIVWVKSC